MNKWDVIVGLYALLALLSSMLVVWFWSEAWHNRTWFPVLVSIPFIAIAIICIEVARDARVTILREF